MASLASVIRALGRIPGKIGGAFVDEEPIMRPGVRRDTIRMPGVQPFDESEAPGLVGVRLGDLMDDSEESDAETPTGSLEQVGTRRRLSRLARGLGEALSGTADRFVTAMNAPNRGAVGTIGQFTGAMGAIRDEQERRDMRDYAMGRQQEQDAQRADLHGAQMERWRAQAREDEAQAAALNVPMSARLNQFRIAFREALGRDPSEQELLVQMKLAAPASAGSDRPVVVGPGSSLFSPSGERLGSSPFAPRTPAASPFAAMVEARTKELGRDLTSQELQSLTQATKTDPRDPFAMVVSQKERELGRDLTSQEMLQLQQQFKQSPYGAPAVVIMRDGSPTIVPRPEAYGQAAPVTMFDMQGNPSTGGVPGISRTAPPAISDAAQDQLANLSSSIQQFQEVRQLMNSPKFQTMGPLLGRIKMAEIGKLGGFGATPEQIQMSVRLQRLLSQQAFAQGGKALTPTELEQFKNVTPSQSDTVQQAIVKSEEALRFLERARSARVDAMSARQRGQVAPKMGGARGPSIPQIGETKSYAGAEYKFNGKDWVLQSSKKR